MINFTYIKQPPRKYTFEMIKLLRWTIEHCNNDVLNLFAGKIFIKGVNINETRVDLNKDMPADYHMDAYEFVLKALKGGWQYDTIVLDPPYNLRKAHEKYFGIYTSKLRLIKNVLPNILTLGGNVISYGYNTTGMGRNRGFLLTDICIVNHSGEHNDTLCTVEKKIMNSIKYLEN